MAPHSHLFKQQNPNLTQFDLHFPQHEKLFYKIGIVFLTYFQVTFTFNKKFPP